MINLLLYKANIVHIRTKAENSYFQKSYAMDTNVQLLEGTIFWTPKILGPG